MIGRLLKMRWWWQVGVVWIVADIAIMVPLVRVTSFRRWMFGSAPFSLFIVLAPVLMGFAWLVVVAPMLEAGAPGFGDRWTGRRRALLCRTFAHVPSVVFGLLLVQFAVVRVMGIDDFGWYGYGYGWWVLGAFALSIFYGRFMARGLERRVRDAAAREEVCMACNYRLTGIASARCPECGAAVE